VHRNNILIYIQDATLHSLFISGDCSTCFGLYLHLSSGAQTTVPTASVIFHTVTAFCRYRGRVGTSLSVLWVAYATHNTLKLKEAFRNSARKRDVSLVISFILVIYLTSKQLSYEIRNNSSALEAKQFKYLILIPSNMATVCGFR
jgi:hypothetical protein